MPASRQLHSQQGQMHSAPEPHVHIWRVLLCSILGWTHLLRPFLHSLLHLSMGPFVSSGAVQFSLSCLGCLYTSLWLAPVYLVSFFMSCRWCAAAAPHGIMYMHVDQMAIPHQLADSMHLMLCSAVAQRRHCHVDNANSHVDSCVAHSTNDSLSLCLQTGTRRLQPWL